MAETPSELQFEIEKLERKHAEHPEGRFFVPLANAYRKMGDVETAEALLRAGVERHPDYLSAHIVLGRCLADRGATPEAEEEFRFVLSEDPQNLIALRTLGELAVADGRPSEAADWYRELLAVDPMNEDARQALDSLSDAPASTEVEAEFRAGAGWWEPATEPSPAPEAPPAEPEAAEPPYEEVDGSSEMVTETIAELYARQGLHDRAASVYRELIRRRGGDPALEQRLEELERKARAEGDLVPDLVADETAAASEVESEPSVEAAEAHGLPFGAETPQDLLLGVDADAEDDSFATSFSEGFSGWVEEETAPTVDTGVEWGTVSGELDAATRSDDSLPGGADEAIPQAPAASSGQTIAHFLAGLAAWRSGTAAATEAATAVEAPPERAADAFAVESAPTAEEADRLDYADERYVPAESAGVGVDLDRGTAAEAEAWVADEATETDADAAALPYLEEVVDDTAAYGTGSAEEEPFPWELPGSAPAVSPDRGAEDEPEAADSFLTEAPAPAREAAPTDDRVPEAPPAVERADVSDARPTASSARVDEDEDLESFQAWLRSLKR